MKVFIREAKNTFLIILGILSAQYLCQKDI